MSEGTARALHPGVPVDDSLGEVDGVGGSEDEAFGQARGVLGESLGVDEGVCGAELEGEGRHPGGGFDGATREFGDVVPAAGQASGAVGGVLGGLVEAFGGPGCGRGHRRPGVGEERAGLLAEGLTGIGQADARARNASGRGHAVGLIGGLLGGPQPALLLGLVEQSQRPAGVNLGVPQRGGVGPQCQGGFTEGNGSIVEAAQDLADRVPEGGGGLARPSAGVHGPQAPSRRRGTVDIGLEPDDQLVELFGCAREDLMDRGAGRGIIHRRPRLMSASSRR